VNREWLSILILIAILVLSGRGDVVPPEPEPTPEPVPIVVVDDAPFPSDALAVLIVEETIDRSALPADQVNVFTSVLIRQKVAELGGEIRVWDQHVDASHDDEKWRLALLRPRESLPWIMIAHGKQGHMGPLPGTVDETIALIEKFK
jgi:hypothetical protein